MAARVLQLVITGQRKRRRDVDTENELLENDSSALRAIADIVQADISPVTRLCVRFKLRTLADTSKRCPHPGPFHLVTPQVPGHL